MRTATRLKILDAAAALLDHSPAAVSMDDVARRAGVSRQTVYSHFTSRAELLVEVVEHIKSRIGFDALVTPVLAAPTAGQALEAFIELHQQFTPATLSAALAVNRERTKDPDVAAAFESRVVGRHQLAHHVAVRLGAEGHLAQDVTVEVAADLLKRTDGPRVHRRANASAGMDLRTARCSSVEHAPVRACRHRTRGCPVDC